MTLIGDHIEGYCRRVSQRTGLCLRPGQGVRHSNPSRYQRSARPTLSFTRQLFPEIKCIQQNSRISVRIHPASKFVQRSEEKNKQTKIQKYRGYLLPDNAPSERCRRIHLDSRDDGRNELEEDYQIKINPHSFNILLLPLGRRSSSKLVVFSTGLPSKRPLLLAVF